MGQPVELLSYFRTRSRSRDWTQQELAEFYRVESALVQHALLISTDRGVSDEGDPWFVFCRAEDEEVIAHVARIGEQYFVVSSAFSGVATGRDFKSLVRALMEAHPMMLPRSNQTKKIFLHPTALLSALVATAYLISSEKSAALEHVSTEQTSKSGLLTSFSQQKVALLSAIALAVTFVEKQVELAFDFASPGTFQSKLDSQSWVQHEVVEHRFLSEQGTHLVQEGAGIAHREILGNSAALEIVQEPHTNPFIGPTKTQETVATRELTADAQFSQSHGDTAIVQGFDPGAISEPHVVVAIAGPELSLDHQAPAEVTSASATRPNSSFLNLASAANPASAAQIVEADLANAIIHHNSAAIVSFSGDIAESLMQLGYSASDARSIGAMALGSDVGHGGSLLTPPRDVAGHSLISANSGSSDPSVPAATSVPTDASTTVANAGPSSTSLSSIAIHSTSSADPAALTVVSTAIPQEMVRTASMLPTFDAQANQMLLSFLHDTEHFAMASQAGGVSMVLMDVNPADMQNPDFRVVEWQVADGSTLTIIGIIPHAPIA